MTQAYFLKTERFEGPLDLLLHLVKVNELNIFDIDIFLVTSQYLEYLRLIDFQDISVASEFLEMGATLIEIKSRMLLPRSTIITDDGRLMDDDPRRSLQERLLEYEAIRAAALELSDQLMPAGLVQYSKEFQRLSKFYEGVEAPLSGDPINLCILYEQLLKSLAERKPATVTVKHHQVNIDQIIDDLKEHLSTTSFALFQGLYHRMQSRYDLVVHIMAILEMAAKRLLQIYQQEPMGPIWIHRTDIAVDALPLEASRPRLLFGESN